MAARACGKPLATGIMVMQAAVSRRTLPSSLPTFEQAAATAVTDARIIGIITFASCPR